MDRGESGGGAGYRGEDRGCRGVEGEGSAVGAWGAGVYEVVGEGAEGEFGASGLFEAGEALRGLCCGVLGCGLLGCGLLGWWVAWAGPGRPHRHCGFALYPGIGLGLGGDYRWALEGYCAAAIQCALRGIPAPALIQCQPLVGWGRVIAGGVAGGFFAGGFVAAGGYCGGGGSVVVEGGAGKYRDSDEPWRA